MIILTLLLSTEKGKTQYVSKVKVFTSAEHSEYYKQELEMRGKILDALNEISNMIIKGEDE
jgi:hypothetical protein